MPQYKVNIPGRGLFDVNSPSELTNEQAYAAVAQQLNLPLQTTNQQRFLSPEEAMRQLSPAEDETAGIFEALTGGTKRLLSSGRTALTAPFVSGEEAALAGIERQQQIKERPATSLEAVKQAYEKDGLFSAAGEVISQIPGALAEQAPFIASIFAGAKAGAALPVPVQFKPFTALAGSLLAPFLQSSGSNMERLASEQLAKGEKVDINEVGAYGIGLGQAALERAALGLSGVSKLLGIDLAKKTAAEGAEEIARKNMAAMIAKGGSKAILAESSTEMGQQLLERYYAGLPLTDDDAKKEYAEAAFGAALLSPLGAYAGYQQSRTARREVARKKQEADRVLEERRRREEAAIQARAEAERLTAAELQAAIDRNNEYYRQRRELILGSIVEGPNRSLQEIIDENTGVTGLLSKKDLLARRKQIREALSAKSGIFIAEKENDYRERELTMAEVYGIKEGEGELDIELEEKQLDARTPITQELLTDQLKIGKTAKVIQQLDGLNPLDAQDNDTIRTLLERNLRGREQGTPAYEEISRYLDLLPTRNDLEYEGYIRSATARGDLVVNEPIGPDSELYSADDAGRALGTTTIPDDLTRLQRERNAALREEGILTSSEQQIEALAKQKQFLAQQKKELAKEPNLQPVLKKIGISRDDLLDITGENRIPTRTGYFPAFKQGAPSLMFSIESGILDRFLPPQMRLENANPDVAFDPTPAYNYISDIIRNNEQVKEYDVQTDLQEIEIQQEQTQEELARGTAYEKIMDLPDVPSPIQNPTDLQVITADLFNIRKIQERSDLSEREIQAFKEKEQAYIDAIETYRQKESVPTAPAIEETKQDNLLQDPDTSITPTTLKKKRDPDKSMYPDDERFNDLRENERKIAEQENALNVEEVIASDIWKGTRAKIGVAKTPKGYITTTDYWGRTGGRSNANIVFYVEQGPFYPTKQAAINQGIDQLRETASKYQDASTMAKLSDLDPRTEKRTAKFFEDEFKKQTEAEQQAEQQTAAEKEEIIEKQRQEAINNPKNQAPLIDTVPEDRDESLYSLLDRNEALADFYENNLKDPKQTKIYPKGWEKRGAGVDLTKHRQMLLAKERIIEIETMSKELRALVDQAKKDINVSNLDTEITQRKGDKEFNNNFDWRAFDAYNIARDLSADAYNLVQQIYHRFKIDGQGYNYEGKLFKPRKLNYAMEQSNKSLKEGQQLLNDIKREPYRPLPSDKLRLQKGRNYYITENNLTVQSIHRTPNDPEVQKYSQILNIPAKNLYIINFKEGTGIAVIPDDIKTTSQILEDAGYYPFAKGKLQLTYYYTGSNGVLFNNFGIYKVTGIVNKDFAIDPKILGQAAQQEYYLEEVSNITRSTEGKTKPQESRVGPEPDADLKTLYREAKILEGSYYKNGETVPKFLRDRIKSLEAQLRGTQEARGVEGTGETRISVAESLREEFGADIDKAIDSGKLTIVDYVNELPDIDLSFNANGAFDNKTGKAYIIASRIAPGEARRVLLHEIGEHYGLERMLGDSYLPTLRRLNTLKDTDPVVKDIWNKVRAQYPELEVGSTPYLQEVMAKLGETAPKNTLFQRVMATVKNFLRKLGFFNPDKLSAKDLQDLISHSLRVSLAESGEVTPSKLAGYIQYSRADTPAGFEDTAALAGSAKATDKTFRENFVDGFEKAKNNPTGSLQDLFTKIRINLAYSGAGINQKLINEYNGAVQDGFGGVRADVIMDQALESNVMASQAAKEGRVEILENGLGKVVQDDNNINNLISLRTQLGRETSPQIAQHLTQAYFTARRYALELSEIDRRNESITARRRAIRDIENSLSSLTGEERQEAKRLIDRYKKQNQRDKEKNESIKITDEQQAAIEPALNYAQQYPVLERMAEMVDAININRINMLEQAGIYDAEQAAEYRARRGYVPLFRDVLEDLDGRNPGVKEFFNGFANLGREYGFTGSDKDVKDVINNLLQQHFWATNTALRNNANRKAAEAVGIHNEAGDLILHRKQPEGAGSVSAPVFIDGERYFVEYSDANLAIGIQGALPVYTGALAWFGNAAKYFRLGITANPIFQSYQVLNDAMSAAMFSGVKDPLKLGTRIISGFVRDQFSRGVDTRAIDTQMARLGVAGGFGRTSKDIFEQAERRLGLTEKTAMRSLYDKVDRFASRSDLAQRRGIFEQTLIETGGVQQADGSIIGGNEVLAMNRALNIINWQKRGASGIVRTLSHTVPFLNAYLQGMDVMINAIRGKGLSGTDAVTARQLFFKTALSLTLFNLLYSMLVASDDEYEELDDRIKFRNYIIPGTGFKLPVRAEISLLTKYIPEQLYQAVTKEGTMNEYDATKLREGARLAITDALLGPNLFPQLVRGTVEVMTNSNFYTGRPLVGLGLSRLATEEQYNEATSQLAKFIGKSGIISPINMDHLIRSYFGTVGSTALFAIDQSANVFYDEKLPAFRMKDVPLLSPILYTEQGRDKLNDFYDLKEASDEVSATMNRLMKYDPKRAREYIQDNQKMVGTRAQVNKLSKQLKDLRDARKQIISSNLSGDQKRERLDNIERQMNIVVRNISRIRIASGL